MTLSKRILISNDDGINAPGIALLEKVARQFCDDVWVVAPETNHSGAGHSLTLRRPLRIREVAEKRFAVDGTPTDCVLLAIHRLMADNPPTLMVSGVNYGVNVAEDITYSGTIAAAMEATLLHIPAIAFSQQIDRHDGANWSTTETWAPKVIELACHWNWPKGVLLNVNFPHCAANEVKGIDICRQGERDPGEELIERIDPRGEPYIWIGVERGKENHDAGTDLYALANRKVSLTPIKMNMTDLNSFNALKKAFRNTVQDNTL